MWTWGQVVIWEVFVRVVFPRLPFRTLPPPLLLPVLCWQLGALGWLLRSGAIFPLLSG